MAGDEFGGRLFGCFRRRDDVPVGAGKLLQLDGGAGEAVESPATGDDSREQRGLGLRLGRRCGGVRRQAGVCEGVGLGVNRLQGRGLTQRDVVLLVLLQDEAAVVGIGGERDVGLGRRAGRGVEMQNEVVGKVSGEDQRRTFDGKNDRGLDEAGDLVGISRAG